MRALTHRCTALSMKRHDLSSFGFRPIPCSDTTVLPSSKRARVVHDESQSEEAEPTVTLQPVAGPSCATASLPCVTQHGDIGAYSVSDLSNLSDEERLWLLQSGCRPLFSIQRRVWQKSIVSACVGEAISMACVLTKCGGYCISCVLFRRSIGSQGQLVTTPMTNFTRAKVTLQEHTCSCQVVHKAAMGDSVEFVSRMEKGSYTDASKASLQQCY